jgi:Zn-dependent protease with chaperone function
VWPDSVSSRIAIAVILLPLLTTLWSRYSALYAGEADAAKRWLESRRTARALRLIMVALWWALWDLQPPPGRTPLWGVLLFWIPPILSIGSAHIIACVTSRTILKYRWTSTDILRLALWATVSPTIALLFIATGFEFIYEKRWLGILWILIAGVAAPVGELRFRAAEGLTLRKVKSGQAYTRAFQLAKKMGGKLERVYVVPAGKGHLTNAYGSARSIAVTDNYGEFLRGSQLDYLIGHELGHAKQKHGNRKLLIVALLFLVPAFVLLILPSSPLPSRPIVDLALMLGLTLASYSVSRRFEYEADRESVELTGDPRTAVYALANLCRVTGTPVTCGRLIELFLTHPSFRRRAEAIARVGKMDLNGIDEILQHAGLLDTTLPEMRC